MVSEAYLKALDMVEACVMPGLLQASSFSVGSTRTANYFSLYSSTRCPFTRWDKSAAVRKNALVCAMCTQQTWMSLVSSKT